MSKLIFEPFTDENKEVVVAGIGLKRSYTYLDEFAALQKNEQKMVEYATDLLEHTYAKQYCDKIDRIGVRADGTTNSDDPTKYIIKNRYITGGVETEINIGNKDTYKSSTDKSACANVKQWVDGTAVLTLPANPMTGVLSGSDSLSPFTDTSLTSFYTDINNVYGKNRAMDVSCINLLTTFSNSMVDDLSNNYVSSDSQSNYVENVGNYNQNVKLRLKLDQAMTELYNGDQSIAMYQKKTLDSVVYANILWTILATSLIYYVFVKI